MFNVQNKCAEPNNGLCRDKGTQKMSPHEILHKGPIYRKLSCCQVKGMRFIAGIALKRSHVCDRSLKVRSITRNCLRNSTAQGWKRWWLGQRVRRGLTRRALDRNVGNITSICLPFFTLCNHRLNVRTCNNIKH